MSKIAKIIPLKKMPRGMDFFDYIVPDDMELKIGDVIEIPFRNITIEGVVYAFADKSEFEQIKSITEQKHEIRTMLPYQLKFIEWFSKYYYQSMGTTLNLILPQRPKRKTSSKLKVESYKAKQDIFVKVQLAKDLIENEHKKFLMFPYDYEQKKNLYLSLVKNYFAKNEQLVLMFPHKEKVQEFYALLTEEQKAKTALVTSELQTKKNLHIQVYEQIKNNEVNLVLGTRSAVFAPFAQAKMIIMDEADNDDYKSWDQNPRYSAVRCAQKLQELLDCKLILSSVCPRIEDAYRAKQEKYKFVELGNKPQGNLNIVDLSHERQKGFTYLSDNLLEQLKTAKKSLLIVNKSGMYSYFMCGDCGVTAKCRSCDMPMIVTRENKLVCRHCQLEQDLSLACPKCKSTNLKKLGIGIEQIQQELQTLGFKASILGEDEYMNQVTLSTGYNIPQRVWSEIDLLGFVYIDSLAYLADFNSNYKLYSFLQNMVVKASKKVDNIVVQTCFPENLAIQSLQTDYKTFFQTEIEQRKQFDYPPFSTSIKLFFQHHDVGIAKREADEVYEALRAKIEDKSENNTKVANNNKSTDGYGSTDLEKIKITEPYLYYLQKVRKRYRYQISLFLKTQIPNSKTQDPDEKAVNLDKENALLSDLPNHWSIDKDPLDLL